MQIPSLRWIYDKLVDVKSRTHVGLDLFEMCLLLRNLDVVVRVLLLQLF